MTAALWLDNLAAYSVQIAVLIAAASLPASLLRLRNPPVTYRGWQILLALCLLAPFVQPWEEVGVAQWGPRASDARFLVLGAAPGFDLSAVVLALVALGVAARLLWLCLGLVRLGRLRRDGRKLCRIPEVLHGLREGLAVRAELYLSGELDGAVSFGGRRPAILLPEAFVSMAPPLQNAVLCHELLHVRRRDWAFTLAEEIIRSVLWFHPAIWWLIERIQLAREQVVDREAIRLTRERQGYLEALLQTAAARNQARFAVAPTFLRRRYLHRRVALILKEDSMSRKRLIFSVTAVAGILALSGIWAGWSFPLQAPTDRWGSGKSGKVYRVSDGVTPPHILYKVEPQYTPQAREAKLQGTVILGIEVGPNGLVQHIQVTRGLGMGLDEKAASAISQWQFQPGQKDGQPVSVAATVEVNFRLL